MSTSVGDEPVVSVVMGTCNDVARVERAVASVLGQGFRELELIVVDDGSTDGSSELLDRLAAADPRMRVIHQENAGLTKALIRGCEAARGRFIARQDSDDWSHPNRISEQVALIEGDASIGFVSCATQFIGPADEPLMVFTRPADPVVATEGLLNERMGPPAHGSVLMRRSCYEQVGGYREQFYFSQDSDLWLRLASISRIAYITGVRYFHRKDIASTSGARRAAQKRFGEIGHRCRGARDKGESEAALLQEAAELTAELRAGRGSFASPDASASLDMNYLIGSMLARNGDARARTYLHRVISARPLHWKAWLRLGQAWLGLGSGR